MCFVNASLQNIAFYFGASSVSKALNEFCRLFRTKGNKTTKVNLPAGKETLRESSVDC
jgi:hypothetical protein